MENRRIERVEIKLTPTEKTELKRAAGRLTVSDYLRDLAGLTGSPVRKLPADPPPAPAAEQTMTPAQERRIKELEKSGMSPYAAAKKVAEGA